MYEPKEQDFWKHFCETGSVDDYIAYRQKMSLVDKGQGDADFFDDGVEYDADHNGWNRGAAKKLW